MRRDIRVTTPVFRKSFVFLSALPSARSLTRKHLLTWINSRLNGIEVEAIREQDSYTWLDGVVFSGSMNLLKTGTTVTIGPVILIILRVEYAELLLMVRPKITLHDTCGTSLYWNRSLAKTCATVVRCSAWQRGRLIALGVCIVVGLGIKKFRIYNCTITRKG
jgi:hypothetical protein